MRILIIEDEPAISTALRKGLIPEGYAIDVAADGEKGSYLARTNEYDLIILDNILPKKDGFSVCKEIRAADKTMPILMLSVKTNTTTKTELLDAGADDYMIKPYSLDELRARIRALLRRPRQIENDILVLGDLVLDIRAQTVMRDKTTINLTRKEFALLEYLMRNKEAALSRGMIMEHVWDMHIDPFSNTIESHILSLRRKLEKRHKKRLIHTISGRGYKCALAK